VLSVVIDVISKYIVQTVLYLIAKAISPRLILRVSFLRQKLWDVFLPSTWYYVTLLRRNLVCAAGCPRGRHQLYQILLQSVRTISIL